MKHTLFFALVVIVWAPLIAQEDSEVVVTQASSFAVSQPMTEIGEPIVAPLRPRIVTNKLRRQKYVNDLALPLGDDPAWQKTHGTRVSRSVDANFDGVSSGWATPPDPSGAIGPDHYVQMTNDGYQVFDRKGVSLYGPVTIDNLWPGSEDAGDPIVMYDKYADRWFLSQFQIGNTGILVAISTTPDPLGTYYTYSFSWNNFPDYPKYSIWENGYYMTANSNGQDAAAFERDKMLEGDPTAQLVQMTIPNFSAPGFKSPLPADADGVLPPAGTPMKIFYFRDDAWSGVSDDVIQIWTMTVDWNDPEASTIEETANLMTEPFDSEFTPSWDDVEQPGTSQRLDAIPGALMYRAQYRTFENHSSIILNHTVDVNGNNQAGVRWYEIRETPNSIFIHQQGSFAPDAESRFMASAAMDYQGNIALAYSISGPEVYPGLRYSGRMLSDPLNSMTLEEQSIMEGLNNQTFTNRYGDYSQLTMDPLDDATFWFTGEYLDEDGDWRTRICSFKIANDFAINVGPTGVVSPSSGVLSGAETVTVHVTNFGLEEQSNFEVAYRVDGGVWNMEVFSSVLASAETQSFTFSAVADLSEPGMHEIEVQTMLENDMYEADDFYLANILHLFSSDVGVASIDSPNSGMGLTETEEVTTTVTNFGSNSLSNIPVSFTLNGGDPVEEVIPGPLASGESMVHTFEGTADMSIPGTYEVVATTFLASDLENSNDSATELITHEACLAVSDCSWGDGFELVVLGSIENESGCGTDGYEDFTSLSTDLQAGSENNLQVAASYDAQFLSAWIDFDDNGFFDEDEILIENLIYDYETTTSLVIALGAPLGVHILRLKGCFQEESDDVCADCTYGETEDYTVNITAHISIPELEFSDLYVSVQGNSLLIHVDELAAPAALTLLNTLGQVIHSEVLPAGSTTLAPVEMRHYSRGLYLIKLEGLANQGGDGLKARSLVRVVY